MVAVVIDVEVHAIDVIITVNFVVAIPVVISVVKLS